MSDDYFDYVFANVEEPKQQFKVLGIDEFLSIDIPPREHVLSPWLPKQGLAMIYAPRGIGKTYIALSIAHAVATGGQFLNWHAPVPRGVLYIDGEMPATLMQERLKGITGTQDKHQRAPFFLLTPDMQEGAVPDLAKPSDQQSLDKYLDGVELIIVDNISTLCRATKENDADAWVPVQDWALRMRASGRSVLFIHHAGKGGNQRGTSKREDILDTVISLKQSEDYSARDGASFEVHYKKARGFFGEDAESFQAKLITDDSGQIQWQSNAVAPDNYEKVVALLKDGIKQNDIANQLNLHKSNISRYAQRARQEGKLRSCAV